MITFQVESWASYSTDPEVHGLWAEQYTAAVTENPSQLELNLDKAAYQILDQTGCLVIVTVRNSSKLIGYCLAVTRRHLHHPTICGFEDTYFLTRTERKGRTGIRLISEMNRVLKERGCKIVYWMDKESVSIAPIFTHLGMTKHGGIYCSQLGN